jgi:hypothetical protein
LEQELTEQLFDQELSVLSLELKSQERQTVLESTVVETEVKLPEQSMEKILPEKQSWAPKSMFQ